MTSTYRALLATISTIALIVAGMFFITNVASGTTPAAFDSGTASCRTDGFGYCNGPTLPFRPNAVIVTVQAPIGGVAVIPSQAMAQLKASGFRSRFFQASGGLAANVTVTYSYVATRGTTPAPIPTPTPTRTSTGSTGTVMSNAFVTGYGWPDNDPPGTAIANPVIHQGASGTGTYADPITLAVSSQRFSPGTRFYIPNVRRYFIAEDTCASCGNVPSGASVWVDMWVGGNGSNDSGVLACENALTGNQTIVLNPDANRVVVAGALFNGATGRCTVEFGW